MTVLLWILAGILLILLIPVRVKVWARPETGVSLGYLFWEKTVYPAEQKPEAAPKKPKKEKPEKEKKQRSAREQLERYLPLAQDLLPRCLRPVRRLLRRTTLAQLELDFSVAGKDAADAAVKFGAVSTAVYTAVTVFDRVFTLRVRRIEIAPDFTSQTGRYCFSVEIRLVPLAALAAAVNLAVLLAASAVRTAFQRRRNQNRSERDVKHGEQAPNQ